MLCQSLLYSKVTQFYTYRPSFFIYFSMTVYHRVLNIVSCALQEDLVVYPSYIQQFASANPKLPVLPSLTSLPLGNPKSVLYVCESVSVS